MPKVLSNYSWILPLTICRTCTKMILLGCKKGAFCRTAESLFYSAARLPGIGPAPTVALGVCANIVRPEGAVPRTRAMRAVAHTVALGVCANIVRPEGAVPRTRATQAVAPTVALGVLCEHGQARGCGALMAGDASIAPTNTIVILSGAKGEVEGSPPPRRIIMNFV